MRAFGAEVELIHSPEGITPELIPAMMRRAAEIAARDRRVRDRSVQQHRHDRGLPAARRGTARQLPGPPPISAFCSYVGTAGCFLGVSRALAATLPGAPPGGGRARRIGGAVGRSARHPPHRGRRHRPRARRCCSPTTTTRSSPSPRPDAFAMARQAAARRGHLLRAVDRREPRRRRSDRPPTRPRPPRGHPPGRQRPEVPQRPAFSMTRLASAGAKSPIEFSCELRDIG